MINEKLNTFRALKDLPVADPAPRPGERWYADNRKFLFRNEADRTLFILRWA